MNSILVLLSTYNGQDFLTEQLESLYGQDGVDFYVLARDDGSTDDTLAILEKYKSKYGKTTIIEGENKGAYRSFFELIDYACTNLPVYDFYAFCDQDDVWFPDKLKISIDCIKDKRDKPALFCSSPILVDSALNKIGQYMELEETLIGTIFYAHNLGCNQVFSRSILEMANKIQPYLGKGDFVLSHDWWIALIGTAFQNVVIGDKPLMLYRQHSNNVVGTSSSNLELLKNRLKRYTKTKSFKSNTCKILYELMGDKLPKESVAIISQCAFYGNSYWNTIKLAFNKDVYCGNYINNILTCLLILCRRF